MEPLTYTLAFSRLARVQCVTWGHPDTTAIPTIDYFISSEDLDMPDAQNLYSEKLIRLKWPAVYYPRPELPSSPKTRGDFGLPEVRPCAIRTRNTSAFRTSESRNRTWPMCFCSASR